MSKAKKRVIDANALKKAIDHTGVDMLESADYFGFTYKKIMRVIDDAPTADVAPVVHGWWLTWEEQFPGEMPRKKRGLGVFCSACHNYSDNMFDYCQNCGCRMDGEDGESDGTKS